LNPQLGVGGTQRRMLRQHALEFGEAARVLIFELHARRPVSVLFGESGHPRRLDEFGNRLGLLAEAVLLRWLGAIAATGYA
jgi:hypothetical protein